MIKQSSTIEPTIGHVKADGRLGPYPDKGGLANALIAVICGAHHSIRMLHKKLRPLFDFIVWAINSGKTMHQSDQQLAVG